MKKSVRMWGTLILILLVMMGMRTIHLDADLPAWGIINYQPMDEGQYATMAIEKIKYGTFRADKYNVVPFMTSAHIRNDIVGNLCIYIGMKLLGNNYYGFRISSVVCACLVLMIYIFVIWKIYKSAYKERGIGNKWLGFIFSCALIFDFTLFSASRVVETTIFRLLFLMLCVLFLFASCKKNAYSDFWRFFLIGGTSVFSVFLVYITNVFVVMAVGITIIQFILFRKNKQMIGSLCVFIAGAGIAYIICDLYYYYVWNSSCLLNTMRILTDFGGTKGYVGGNGIYEVLRLFAHIISSNSNMYNIIILFLMLIGLPMIAHMYKKMKFEIVCLCNIVICFFLQTLITEDYVIRKYILIFPLALIILYYVLLYSDCDFSGIKRHKIISALYFWVSLAVCTATIIFRTSLIGNKTYKDFSKYDIMFFTIFISVTVILAFVFFAIQMKQKNAVKLIIICISINCLFNLVYDLKYSVFNNNYSEKEAMIAIGEEVGEEYVLGVYSIAFTLYNDIKPIVNDYDEIVELYPKYKYYLDYSDYSFPNDLNEDNLYQLIETKTFDRDFSTFGKQYNVSLYKIKEK